MSPRTPKSPDDAALEGGRRRATINDIARIAGVSKKTVSRVINRSPSLRPETREKIEAVIAKYSYAPDPQARGLAFRRSFLIGLIYDKPNPQFVVDMQMGLLDGMRGSGFELVVHPCDQGSATLAPDIRSFIERQKLFGVVLTPSISEDEGVAAMLREIGCEYVRVASVAMDKPEHSIVTLDRHGGLLAGRHLAELGHRRVGFISGPPTLRSSHERRRGLEDGLSEYGMNLLPEHVAEGADTFESGQKGAAKLLATPNRPTAIFASNDEMAAGVLHAARGAGLSVPEDLSVIGFDDFQIASRVWPSLTTVRSPTHEIGRVAAEKLIGQGGGGQRDQEGWRPSLVARDSTAPPRL